ncbi:S-adenosyl-L-methionine-dependent methyltransferase [Leucogyrophana mollusca]|uniref:S-adenosyl-L-methionine-dependent methyltransferase n=1 Tax=Leucogyrophana mollusca TaxID=85980 RepID=A0ACB8BUP9_9AGAM|nr:S-adenosyl-L-methionine-dependent methyltransferase [Leucogyrophana mollusca]
MPVLLDAKTIASFSLHNPDHFGIQLGQTEHRINLVSAWQIKEGDHVLEVGCGQGDCTAVLAAAVGESGRVTAIDPAPLDYGDPYTLGEAQAHLKASPLGARMNFVRANTEDILAADDTIYDVAVLAHCIWYFASPSALLATLRALSPRATRISLAEWSLAASHPAAVPHLLAALAQASLECRKPASVSNIRTVLSPRALGALAGEAGLRVVGEGVVESPGGMEDGQWEVVAVLGRGFGEEVGGAVGDERERGVVCAMRDAVAASKEGLGGERVRAMDVWWGCFEGRV